MRLRAAFTCLALVLTATAVGHVSASGADFSPSARYWLCEPSSAKKCVGEYERGAAVQFRVRLAQDEGEEELKHVTLKIPAGFRLPKDRRIEDGEKLGTAHIDIAFGPGCAGGTGSQTFPIDGEFVERDRTAKERRNGVRVVFRLDLTPIPPIDLKVFGNRRTGYHVESEIPNDPATCPPFEFSAAFSARSETSDVVIFRNPQAPGIYRLRVILRSTEGSVHRVSQRLEII